MKENTNKYANNPTIRKAFELLQIWEEEQLEKEYQQYIEEQKEKEQIKRINRRIKKEKKRK